METFQGNEKWELTENIYCFLKRNDLKGVSLDTDSFVTICSEITHNLDFVMKNISKEKMAKIQHQLKTDNSIFLKCIAEPVLFNSEIKVFLSKSVQEELDSILKYFAGEREKERAEILIQKNYSSKEINIIKEDYKKRRLMKQVENICLSRNIKRKNIEMLLESVQNDFLFLTASSNFVKALKRKMPDADELYLFYHEPKSFTGF